ncbi:hypothetical protein T07_15206 [Trichinella nelsoni]|uniref:PiggyBac transposable element-derived protein domain-containing protein n=1 Tax=Trichinella nelsoni TaxID=6336 RepID=A0A0V0S443_9BILA|nr:hypothetical protein T07_15206 [Trichinella nelsoni]
MQNLPGEDLVFARNYASGPTWSPASVGISNRKYGVKINWICDAENGYALKGLLYTGRSSEEPQIGLASTNVGQLAQQFVNSNRNVYMDCYFTSYSTVKHLLEHGLTAIGTVFAIVCRDVPACSRKAARRDLLLYISCL